MPELLQVNENNPNLSSLPLRHTKLQTSVLRILVSTGYDIILYMYNL